MKIIKRKCKIGANAELRSKEYLLPACGSFSFAALPTCVWAETCPAEVTAYNDLGLERIKVVSPCRHNETFRASYGTFEQQAVFSDDGVATLAVALTDVRSAIVLTFQDNSEKSTPVDLSNLATVFRITIQWDMPVDLNLHVVEPRGTAGGRGDATVGHSPEAFGLARQARS